MGLDPRCVEARGLAIVAGKLIEDQWSEERPVSPLEDATDVDESAEGFDDLVGPQPAPERARNGRPRGPLLTRFVPSPD